MLDIERETEEYIKNLENAIEALCLKLDKKPNPVWYDSAFWCSRECPYATVTSRSDEWKIVCGVDNETKHQEDSNCYYGSFDDE
jgi:hypothetical protein